VKASPGTSCRPAADDFMRLLGNTIHRCQLIKWTAFHQYARIEPATGTRFYFAPPYQAWRRGTCENTQRAGPPVSPARSGPGRAHSGRLYCHVPAAQPAAAQRYRYRTLEQRQDLKSRMGHCEVKVTLHLRHDINDDRIASDRGVTAMGRRPYAIAPGAGEFEAAVPPGRSRLIERNALRREHLPGDVTRDFQLFRPWRPTPPAVRQIRLVPRHCLPGAGGAAGVQHQPASGTDGARRVQVHADRQGLAIVRSWHIDGGGFRGGTGPEAEHGQEHAIAVRRRAIGAWHRVSGKGRLTTPHDLRGGAAV
jgi:hypothetical protein